MKLKISPCPNDTFIFYAMLHNKVDIDPMNIDVEYLDIEELNSALLRGHGDVIKASAVMTHAATNRGYELLDAGAALGRGCGPIVVSAQPQSPASANIARGVSERIVALPGEHTTAAHLFHRYYPEYTPLYTRFDKVAQMVKHGGAELGVLIHEGRFTYEQQGLTLVGDLGQMWEEETRMPIPLGGIFAQSDQPTALISSVIKASLAYALEHPHEPMDYVRHHAQELAPDVLQNHISYFVNDYTLSLGREGRAAFEQLAGGFSR